MAPKRQSLNVEDMQLQELMVWCALHNAVMDQKTSTEEDYNDDDYGDIIHDDTDYDKVKEVQTLMNKNPYKIHSKILHGKRVKERKKVMIKQIK